MLFLGVVAPASDFLSSARVSTSARLGDGVGSIAIRLFGAPADVLLCSGLELGLPDRVLAGSFHVEGAEVWFLESFDAAPPRNVPGTCASCRGTAVEFCALTRVGISDIGRVLVFLLSVSRGAEARWATPS
ncbi:unnamed protein product [Sphagnum jensenii]|uniref:Secreted protein n=1 Tax=Sphagnum jensenii TaxID=128206 RepID=A0ABP0WG79_9BRYO